MNVYQDIKEHVFEYIKDVEGDIFDPAVYEKEIRSLLNYLDKDDLVLLIQENPEYLLHGMFTEDITKERGSVGSNPSVPYTKVYLGDFIKDLVADDLIAEFEYKIEQAKKESED